VDVPFFKFNLVLTLCDEICWVGFACL